MISDQVGDLLLTFGGLRGSLPSRFVANLWQDEITLDGWGLQICRPGEGWAGFPVIRIGVNEEAGWLLGEFYSKPGAFQEFEDLEALSEWVQGLNGRFLVLYRDPVSRNWHLWTDRFGTLHAYYATDGRYAALGTFSPAVAAAASSRKFDWEALAAFFSFGYFPNDRTQYADLHILRPASHYVFSDNGRQLSRETYWQWQHNPDPNRSYEDTVRAYDRVFREVLDDHLFAERVALPISGGLDSRSSLLTVTQNQERYWAYSYGYSKDSVETRIAHRLAVARDLPFQAFTIRPYLFQRMESVLAWTEGFQDITQSRQAYVRDEIADRSDVLVGAVMGDLWHDDIGLYGRSTSPGQPEITAHVLKKIKKPFGDLWLERLLKPQLPGVDLSELLAHFVHSELEPLEHIEDPDFRVKAYKTNQWCFRWSLAPIRVFQSAAWPRLIFYDHRLTDFFLTVPTAYVTRRRLQIDHLKQYAPDLARVKWQVYDADLFSYQHFKTWQLPRRALKKAWRMMRRARVLERNWEVQLLGPEARQGLRRWLTQGGLHLHEFISPHLLESVLADFERDPWQNQETPYGISMLLTFSAWLESYGG